MNVDPSAATAAEPNAASAASRAPESIGKYRLDRTLGTGGMGVVWAAFDTDLQRPVALKLLHAENANTTQRSRLLREAIAMARLRHPNVVTVYDVGTVNGRDYIAMELVEGGTLDAWLATRPPRKDIVEALLAAGRGLAAAHARARSR
jgi:serine/threonine protein kinase